MATKTAAKKGAAKTGGAKKTASLKKGASSRAVASPSVRQQVVRITATSKTPFDRLVKDLARQLTFKKPGIGGCNPCFSGLDRVIIENPETMRKLR
ncbi:MAG: hypothetical protein WBP93_02160 [Pyrinomonadaceae bacterium]